MAASRLGQQDEGRRKKFSICNMMVSGCVTARYENGFAVGVGVGVGGVIYE